MAGTIPVEIYLFPVRWNQNEKEKLFAIMPQKPKFLDETINRYIEAGNIIYYKRNGSYADYYCCQCGEKFTRRIKATEAYAGPSVDIVPRRYQSKECPKCKRKGTLLNWGRAKITKQEFAILELLLKNPKQVFSKEDIFEYAWDEPYMGETKTLDVHISNIRKKIKTVTPDEYIETIWGIGYRLHE